MIAIGDKRPEVIVFAGPNGSGKSTFTELLKPPTMDYINADEIKKNLKCTDLEAAQIAEKQREEHLTSGLDFCFETVMSTDRNVELLRRARSQGYFIRVYYIVTASPLINVGRVKNRVLTGGHDVPRDKIISRYAKSLARIKPVVALSDVCHIYDNSSREPFRIFKRRKTEYYYEESKYWTKDRIEKLTEIHEAINKPLNK